MFHRLHINIFMHISRKLYLSFFFFNQYLIVLVIATENTNEKYISVWVSKSSQSVHEFI